MQFTPGVMQSLADMLESITPGDGIEISDHNNGIGAVLYLCAYDTRLLVTQRHCSTPFSHEALEGRQETFVIAFIHFGYIRRSETVGLEVVVEEPNGVVSLDYIASVGHVASCLIVDAMLVDKRVFGPHHSTILMPFIIDCKIQIGIGVFLAERLLNVLQGEPVCILIDIHFLKTDDVGVLHDKVLQHLVLVRLVRIIHPRGIPCQDGDRYEKGIQHSDVSIQIYFFGVNVIRGMIISSREMPPCWKVLR